MKEIKELREYQRRENARADEIAQAVGVTGRTIYRWLSSEVKRIHPLQLHRLRLFLKRKTAEMDTEK
jgi:predicted DNA-binding transcriptional regulator YafY